MRFLACVLGKRIFVAPFLKVPVHCLRMRTSFWTKSEFLKGIGDRSVFVNHVETGLTFGFLGPLDECIPVLAFAWLAASDLVFLVDGGHGSVIGKAHDVLTQCVETVINVSRGDGGFGSICAVNGVEVGATNIFLLHTEKKKRE